jgi:DNA repair protein RadA/Sms
MAIKSKKEFVCKSCGYKTVKWLGRCPNCESWNSFEEITTAPSVGGSEMKVEYKSAETIEDILKNDTVSHKKYPFSTDLLNTFWNKGLVPGSLTLLAGEPGLGKSTLSLQLLRSLCVANPKLKLLYLTAEESSIEVARRSNRLDIPKTIMILQANLYEVIEREILKQKPQVLIIDSVQTVYSGFSDSSPGSVNQISAVTNNFLSLAKSYNISVILIGHVTKEGQVAGPKALEHLVDSVLLLEQSEVSGFRTLGFSKHRYGTTENQILLKMEEKGLEIITDPSLALLGNLEKGIGVCYGLAVQKNLPMVVEIQTLVAGNPMGASGFGRREAIGFKLSKLNTIIAICEKYLGLNLRSYDVYSQVVGLPKSMDDNSLDLPILLSILSSFYNKEISAFLNLDRKIKPIFAGRLTLSGSIREPTYFEQRQKVADNLKFNLNSGVKYGEISEIIEG